MNYFIAYDITSDRLRKKISDCLLRHGCKRVQYSLFFAPQFTPQELKTVRLLLEQLLSSPASRKTDSVFCIPMEKDGMGQLLWQGDAERFDKIMQEVHALFV